MPPVHGDETVTKAKDLGLRLDELAFDALDKLSLDEAFDLLESVADQGDGIKNPTNYVIGACRRMEKGKGGGPGKGAKSTYRAQELGIDLSDEVLDKLKGVSLEDAYKLLDDVAKQGDKIKNLDRYVESACEKMRKGGGGGKGSKSGGAPPGGKGKSGGGGKSASRAQELGLDLSDVAIGSLSQLKLEEAYELLEQLADKGSSVRNPSSWIVKACEKMSGPAPPARVGPAPLARVGPPAPRPAKGGGKSPGGKSGARAAELGLDLDESALATLATVPLTDAYDLLASLAEKGTGKGGIRDPNRWIESACAKINRNAIAAPAPVHHAPAHASAAPKGKGKGKALKENSVEDRVILLNRANIWGSDKIDVEALMSLKKLRNDDAQDLLDELEVKGAGVKNPSNYLLSAARRISSGTPMGSLKRGHAEIAAPAIARGRPQALSEAPRGGNKSADRARALGLSLNPEALSALSTVALHEAMYIIEETAKKGATVRDPSGFIVSAIKKGIIKDGPPAKRPRVT